ncbi:ERF family protein [Streptomyces globisporus]|uniref:ERF family protein n=1 Tax=Streptomyces globisporus TaxID=1908 RepID=UPI00067E561B|nr:ERF family protein [Streptomyces globisporus]
MTVTTLPTAHAHAHALAPEPAPVRTPDVVYVPAPEGVPADAPRVFAAINGVMRDAMPVGKDQRNEQQNYQFRGIDDVMSAMAGPMRTHGVFILPTIAEHSQTRDGKMTRTMITMRYRVYGPAGDCLVADVPGEAFDYADKSTNKAQSAALKYLLFTLFMLPVDGRSIDDGDRTTPEPPAEHRAEQQQRQQRQQGRQQRGQGQQRQQQPRRSNRAEAGPWEQQAPAQQQQRRDYLAEAKAAPNPDAFAKVRAAAVKAGAPADYLATLDQVAAKKREAAQKPKQQAPTGPTPHSISDAVAAEGALGTPPPAAEQHVDQEQAAALGEFYDAARSAGVTDRAEADQLFNSRHGGAPAAATAAQLRDMRDDLLDAAKGATA